MPERDEIEAFLEGEHDLELLDPEVEARELFRFLQDVQRRKLVELKAEEYELRTGEHPPDAQEQKELETLGRLMRTIRELLLVDVDALEDVAILPGAPNSPEVRWPVGGDGELTDPVPLRCYTGVRNHEGRIHAMYVLGWTERFGVVCEVI